MASVTAAKLINKAVFYAFNCLVLIPKVPFRKILKKCKKISKFYLRAKVGIRE